MYLQWHHCTCSICSALLNIKILISPETSRAASSHLVSPPGKGRHCCYYCYCYCRWDISSPPLLFHPQDWRCSSLLPPPPQMPRSSTPPWWLEKKCPLPLRPSVKSLVLLILESIGWAVSQQLCLWHPPAGLWVRVNSMPWPTWVGVYTGVCVCDRIWAAWC